MVGSVCVVLAFVSNDWFMQMDKPYPNEALWWTQHDVARPHHAGLFRQCGAVGCTFIQPGEEIVKYPTGYLYVDMCTCTHVLSECTYVYV